MDFMKKRMPCVIVAAFTLIMILVFSLIKGGKVEGDGDGRLSVTATTTMLYDLVKQIGGDHVIAQGLMGSGIDPHQYRASAKDIVKMQTADVVVYNGLHLEGKMGDVLASLEKSGRTVICVSDNIPEDRLIINDGVPDPHIWFDVSLWRLAAAEVAEGLSSADPVNSKEYKSNLEIYQKQLDQLENYILSKTAEIPEGQRVLITAHDAFGYFGKAYGFEVKGLQGISTVAEAGTSDVGRLAEYIAENRIKAVYVESSMPVKNIEALREAVKAKGFETCLGGSLYSDSTGDEKSGTQSYIGSFKSNIDAIAEGLL